MASPNGPSSGEIDLEAAAALRRLDLAAKIGWGLAACWGAVAYAVHGAVFEPRGMTGFFNVNSTLVARATYVAGAAVFFAQLPLVILSTRRAERMLHRLPGGPGAVVYALQVARRSCGFINGVSLATGLGGLALFLATGNGAALGFMLAAACVGHEVARPGPRIRAYFARISRR